MHLTGACREVQLAAIKSEHISVRPPLLTGAAQSRKFSGLDKAYPTGLK